MPQPLEQDSPVGAGSAVTTADEVAAAVAAAPGVSRLSGGHLGAVGTYLPGRRVTGVVLREEDVEVRVIGRYGIPVGNIAAEVRQAAEPFAGGRPVHVIIEIWPDRFGSRVTEDQPAHGHVHVDGLAGPRDHPGHLVAHPRRRTLRSPMPAVFVNGNPENAAIWEPLLAELDRTDVMRLPPPGFGAAIPDDFDCTVPAYREWLTAELEALGEPVDLVGHDVGGSTVVSVAMARPGLLRTWASDSPGGIRPALCLA